MLSLTLRQYLGIVAIVLGIYASFLLWEITQNIPGYNLQYQIFLFGLFSILLVWFAFFGGFISKIRRRLRFQKEETKQALEEVKIEIEEHQRTQAEKDNLIIELKEAISEVRTLSGLLPICASCKNIRDDKGYWNKLESYIQYHSEAEFSHSIYPDCIKKLYPDLADEEGLK